MTICIDCKDGKCRDCEGLVVKPGTAAELVLCDCAGNWHRGSIPPPDSRREALPLGVYEDRDEPAEWEDPDLPGYLNQG